jgi:hypothetical protein
LGGHWWRWYLPPEHHSRKRKSLVFLEPWLLSISMSSCFVHAFLEFCCCCQWVSGGVI